MDLTNFIQKLVVSCSLENYTIFKSWLQNSHSSIGVPWKGSIATVYCSDTSGSSLIYRIYTKNRLLWTPLSTAFSYSRQILQKSFFIACSLLQLWWRNLRNIYKIKFFIFMSECKFVILADKTGSPCISIIFEPYVYTPMSPYMYRPIGPFFDLFFCLI